MIPFGEQSTDDMDSGIQFDFLAFGAVAHMNMLSVFADAFAQIHGQVGVYQNVMMAATVIHTFFGRFYRYA